MGPALLPSFHNSLSPLSPPPFKLLYLQDISDSIPIGTEPANSVLQTILSQKGHER